MIRSIFEERIEMEKGVLVRVTNARWATKRDGSGDMDVFKIYEDGRELCRNLCYTRLGGYLLEDVMPDEWSEPLMKCQKFHDGFGNAILTAEKDLLTKKYPGFRWMLQKGEDYQRGMQIAEAWELLNAWKRWPESERLLNGGYWKLAVSKRFAEAPYLEQKRMAEYLKTHPGIVDPGYSELLSLMKSGMAQWQYRMMKRFRLSKDILEYYSRQLLNCAEEYRTDKARELHHLYNDYLDMARTVGHDTEDPYWKYPKDLKKAHDKAMKENERIKARKERKKQKAYLDAVKKYLGKELDVDGLRVYVPGNVDEIVHQAEGLHQCLVYADYIGKVAEYGCLLVFIKRNGEPMATAELDKNGKVVQFYGDELTHDTDKMKPGKECESALNKWISKFRPRIRKPKNIKEVA